MATYGDKIVVSTQHSEHEFEVGRDGVTKIFYDVGGAGTKVWIKNSDDRKNRIFFGDVQIDMTGKVSQD